MTQDHSAQTPRATSEPEEIAALLPWYAAGTLRRRERQRVENALRADGEAARQLARHVELVREELAETIHLNETLGVPPAAIADRLMAAIDAETQAARRRAPVAAGWLTGFFANLSPRTMALAASFAVLAIALQSIMLVDVFTKPQNPYQAAAPATEHHHGTFAMIRFAHEASAAEITNFLQHYQATLVDGPTPGGFYRVRVTMVALAKEELGRVVARMRQERIVETAELTE